VNNAEEKQSHNYRLPGICPHRTQKIMCSRENYCQNANNKPKEKESYFLEQKQQMGCNYKLSLGIDLMDTF